MYATTFLLLLATSLPSTSAAPHPTEAKIEFAQLERRGNTDKYGDYTGSTSKYGDGEGTYITSGDVAHYGGDNPQKCWTDVFYVSQSYEADQWTKSNDGDIDCNTTSVCDSGVATANLKCSSWNIGGSAGVEWEIVKDVLTLSGSFEPSGGAMECTTATTTKTCHWNDQKCHALWTSTVLYVNHGYIRRRCAGGGDHTVWSKDWDATSSTGYAHEGCAATCDMTTYPGALPVNNGAVG